MLNHVEISMVAILMLVLVNFEVTKQWTFYGIQTLSVMTFAAYVKKKNLKNHIHSSKHARRRDV